MIKTEKEIQSDFFAMVKSSPLASAVSGSVYRATKSESLRPRDSVLEDIEVILTVGYTEQVQEGTITILVYVPDVDPYNNGVKVENGARTSAIARVAQNWIDSCPDAGTGYEFEQRDIIESVSIPEINQHAVSIQINYKFFE